VTFGDEQHRLQATVMAHVTHSAQGCRQAATVSVGEH
jgi:hypothetical protein